MTDIRIKVPGATDDSDQVSTSTTPWTSHLRKTNAWRYDHRGAADTRNQDDYPIFPPAGTALVRVLEATHVGGQ